MPRVRVMGLATPEKAAELRGDDDLHAQTFDIPPYVRNKLYGQQKIFADFFHELLQPSQPWLPPDDVDPNQPITLVDFWVPEDAGDVASLMFFDDVRVFSSPNLRPTASCPDLSQPLVPTKDDLNTLWMVPKTVGTAALVREKMGVRAVPAFQELPKPDDPIIAIFDGGLPSASKTWSHSVAGRNADKGLEWHGRMAEQCVGIAAPFAQLWDVPILKQLSSKDPKPEDETSLASPFEGLAWLIDQKHALEQATSIDRPFVASNAWGILQDAFAPNGVRASSSTDPWDWSDYISNPLHPFALLVRIAVQEGISMVFAAGNCGPEGFDLPCGPPEEVGPGKSIRGVNGAKDVICVAAADTNGALLSNSSPGPSMYLPEPTTLYDAKPDVSGFSGFRGDAANAPEFNMGTSAACGVVAGGAALLLRQHPSLSPEDVLLLLRQSADPPRPELPSCYSYHWGAGLIDLKEAHGLATPATPGGVAPDVVGIIDGILGRPYTCRNRIWAICENREDVFDAYGVQLSARSAIEQMDGPALVSMLEEQLGVVLDASWDDRSTLPPPAIGRDDGAAACDGRPERPTLLLNVIADLGRSPAARRHFRERRSVVLRTRYDLSADALRRAEAMSPATAEDDAEFAAEECRTAMIAPEMQQFYPNVQSFPGPWVEYFSPSVAYAGATVKITLEGRGFAVRHPLTVGLVQRCIESKKTCAEQAAEVQVGQTIPWKWLADPDAVTLSIDAKDEYRDLIEEACDQAYLREPPATCPPYATDRSGDVSLARVEKVGPAIGPSRLRLRSLQLGEKFDEDASTPRFRLEAYLELKDVSPGDYDLWVAFCDETGCETRAAAGPTVFRVLDPPPHPT